jgi:rare lipoprotein A
MPIHIRYQVHAQRRKARRLQAALVIGLTGLLPLATSSAATADPATAVVEPAATAAVIELVPVDAIADDAQVTVASPSLPLEAPAPAPVESATSLGRGSASFYAAKFNGRRTASGEVFDNGAMTAAHRTLPFGSMVRVTNPANGRSVIVRINDRGPFVRGRSIDVSRAAAEQLGMVSRGHAIVELELVES